MESLSYKKVILSLSLGAGSFPVGIGDYDKSSMPDLVCCALPLPIPIFAIVIQIFPGSVYGEGIHDRPQISSLMIFFPSIVFHNKIQDVLAIVHRAMSKAG